MLARNKNVPEASHKSLDAIVKHCLDNSLAGLQVLYQRLRSAHIWGKVSAM
jgi:hypothetical protein